MDALSEQVRSLIRTGVALSSISQVIEELVLNSIDAGSSNIAVRVDLSSFKIQVIDNGQGINEDQFALIGQRYTTSKCHSYQDLEHLKHYGYRGEALASIKDVSSFMEIVSRPSGSCITLSKCFQKGKQHLLSKLSTLRPHHGTTITVHNLFHNMPVRRNYINAVVEIEKIKYRISGLALMWPNIVISLRNEISNQIILQTKKRSSVLGVFHDIFCGINPNSFIEMSAEKGDYSVSGHVCKGSHHHKDLQFVYVNKRLALNSCVHKQVNRILNQSLILKRKDGSSGLADNFTFVTGKTGSPSKLTDCYGIYILNIFCSFKMYDMTFEPRKTLVEFRDKNKLNDLIEDMMYKALMKENLINKESMLRDDSKHDRSCKSLTLNLNDNTTNGHPILGTHENLDRYARNLNYSFVDASDILFSKPVTRCEASDLDNTCNSMPEKILSDFSGAKASSLPVITEYDSLSCLEESEQPLKNVITNSIDTNAQLFDEHILLPSVQYNDYAPVELLNAANHNKTKMDGNIDNSIKETNYQKKLQISLNDSVSCSTGLREFRKLKLVKDATEPSELVINTLTEFKKASMSLSKGESIIQKTPTKDQNTISHSLEKETLNNDLPEKGNDKINITVPDLYSTKLSFKSNFEIVQSTTPVIRNAHRKEQAHPVTKTNKLAKKKMSVNLTKIIPKSRTQLSTDTESESDPCTHKNYFNKRRRFHGDKTVRENGDNFKSGALQDLMKKTFSFNSKTSRQKKHTSCDLSHTDELVKKNTTFLHTNSNENKSKQHAEKGDEKGQSKQFARENFNTSNILSNYDHNSESISLLEESSMNRIKKCKKSQVFQEDMHTHLPQKIYNMEKNQIETHILDELNLSEDFHRRSQHAPNALDLYNQTFDQSSNVTISEPDDDPSVISDSTLSEPLSHSSNCLEKCQNLDNIVSVDYNLNLSNESCPSTKNFIAGNVSVPMECDIVSRKRKHNWNAVPSEQSPLKKNSLSLMLKEKGSEYLKQYDNMYIVRSNEKGILMHISTDMLSNANLSLFSSNSSLHMLEKGLLFAQCLMTSKYKFKMKVLKQCLAKLCCRMTSKADISSSLILTNTQFLNSKLPFETAVTLFNNSRQLPLNIHNKNHHGIESDKNSISDVNREYQIVNDETDVGVPEFPFSSTQIESYATNISGSFVETPSHFNTPKVTDIDHNNDDLTTGSSSQPIFQSPFFKKRIERGICELKNIATDDQEQSRSVINNWKNPVLKYHKPISYTTLASTSGRSIVDSCSNFINSLEFSNNLLKTVKVLGQIEKKFIACSIEKTDFPSHGEDKKCTLLALFDQHAVHERIRLETLTSDTYEANGKEKIMKRTTVNPPICFTINCDDARVVKAFHAEFHRIGVSYKIEETSQDCAKISIHSLPSCMVQHALDGRESKDETMVRNAMDLIKDHIQHLKATNGTFGRMPMSIHRLLCSQACHGAIRFGEQLELDRCRELLKELTTCSLPFQCAHGRPSVVPLFNFNTLISVEQPQLKRMKPNLGKLKHQIGKR